MANSRLNLKPSDELETSLSQSHNPFQGLRPESLLGFGAFFLLCPPLLTPLGFGYIGNLPDLLQMVIHKQHQIVGQTNELELHGLGCFRTGPRFLFLKFAFNLIKDLLDIPAHPVEMGDHSRG